MTNIIFSNDIYFSSQDKARLEFQFLSENKSIDVLSFDEKDKIVRQFEKHIRNTKIQFYLKTVVVTAIAIATFTLIAAFPINLLSFLAITFTAKVIIGTIGLTLVTALIALPIVTKEFHYLYLKNILFHKHDGNAYNFVINFIRNYDPNKFIKLDDEFIPIQEKEKNSLIPQIAKVFNEIDVLLGLCAFIIKDMFPSIDYFRVFIQKLKMDCVNLAETYNYFPEIKDLVSEYAKNLNHSKKWFLVKLIIKKFFPDIEKTKPHIPAIIMILKIFNIITEENLEALNMTDEILHERIFEILQSKDLDKILDLFSLNNSNLILE